MRQLCLMIAIGVTVLGCSALFFGGKSDVTTRSLATSAPNTAGLDIAASDETPEDPWPSQSLVPQYLPRRSPDSLLFPADFGFIRVPDHIIEAAINGTPLTESEATIDLFR